MKTVLTEVAEQFHVSPEEVRAEIARAIHLALTSSDPEVKRRWTSSCRRNSGMTSAWRQSLPFSQRQFLPVTGKRTPHPLN